MTEVYKTPEIRLQSLRKANGTLDQDDPSSYREVTLDDIDVYLMEHRSTDVPSFNEFSAEDMRGYILDGYKVYQYKMCWVPEKFYIGEDEWLYVGKVADDKNMSYRLVKEYAVNGFLTSDYFKIRPGYPRRRYVKNDRKLQYWVSKHIDILLPRLEIAAELLPSCETLEDLYAAIEKYEKDNNLIIRGIKRLIEPHTIEEYFAKHLNNPPSSYWGWRLKIKEMIANEYERRERIRRDNGSD